MSVEPMDEGLNGWLVEVSEVRCALSGLLAKHEGLGVDQTEGINDDLAFD